LKLDSKQVHLQNIWVKVELLEYQGHEVKFKVIRPSLNIHSRMVRLQLKGNLGLFTYKCRKLQFVHCVNGNMQRVNTSTTANIVNVILHTRAQNKTSMCCWVTATEQPRLYLSWGIKPPLVFKDITTHTVKLPQLNWLFSAVP